MVKIRLAIIFMIAQVVLTKYTSRRFRSRIVEDRAIRCNRNIEANSLSNTFVFCQNLHIVCFKCSSIGILAMNRTSFAVKVDASVMLSQGKMHLW